MELKFKQEKETKNTVRYQEQSDGNVVIGPLYVQKSAFSKNPPTELTLYIALESDEDGAFEELEDELNDEVKSETVEETA